VRLKKDIEIERVVIEFLLAMQYLIRVSQDKLKQTDYVLSSDTSCLGFRNAESPLNSHLQTASRFFFTNCKGFTR
jgi:hypothetical protein